MADGKRIVVQKVRKEPASPPSQSDDDLAMYADVCYYYPGHTMPQARKLPYKYIRVMLKRARQLEALRYKNLTQIVAAAQTDKLKGVDELINHYEKQMNE